MSADVWPPLPLADWIGTRDTLQLWTQIVGKVRMVSTPMLNHWWNVPLYVSARGLTTSLIPRGERAFQIDFDLVEHQLHLSVSDGSAASMVLESRTVADFYHELMGTGPPSMSLVVEEIRSNVSRTTRDE